MSEEAPQSRPRKRLLRWRRRRPRGPRARRLPFDLGKALFILPNAFTVSSIFCGLYAILEATHPSASSLHMYQAALAIFLAGFFDMFDGRVARMTRTQSDFGVQMDSLADVISFGVAPAVLVYKWGLQDLGLWGRVIAFSFAACGAIRLARFNVLEARGEGSKRYFIGLPIPIAATMLISLVIAQTRSFEDAPVQAHGAVLALVGVLSYLMVSNVRYRTFKDFRPNARNMLVVAIIGAGLITLVVTFRASVALVAFVGGYILYGLIEEVIFFRHRQKNDPAPVSSVRVSNTGAKTKAEEAPSPPVS